MAVANGFGKVVTSGSAFMYDTGDTFNSYKGQPGTNITTGVNRNYNGYFKDTFSPGVFFETNGYTEVVNIPALGPTTVQSIEINNSAPGVNCCPSLFNYTGGWMSSIWLPGQTYSYQIIYKCASGYTHPNFMYHYEYTSGESYLTEYGVFDTNKIESLGDGWYHAWNTFTTNASAAKGYTGLWYYQYYVADKVSIAAVSITPGDTIRPPREIIPSGTTRSATQGLLPLVGDSSINLSTVSFNSNAQMIFDGTDDYISIPYSSNLDTPNGCTYELMVYPTGDGEIVNKGSSDGTDNPRIYMYSNGNIYFDWSGPGGTDRYVYSTSNLTLNSWNHLICTATPGSTLNIYINGVPAGSGATLPNPLPNTTDNIELGRLSWLSNRYWSGQINIFKIYNRALTSSEVTQNYNKYKTRFNLP
jgi:hypothetical protein